ncbi:MAG TPA: glycosyltransferase [Myxococcales bacterium]|jgi:glycosyltransferase involved in cell wall biosynthesis|nr:glycosyltransferase [Myxococcales bacterium]
MRVLYILPTLDVGGAERSLLELFKRLDGIEPVLCSLGHGGTLLPQFEAVGIPVRSLRLSLGGADVRGGMRLLPLIHEVRPRLIHSRLFNANFWARICGRLSALPVLAEERGVEETRPRWATLLNRLSEPLGNLTTANSAAVREMMLRRDRVPEERLQMVAGAVDAQRYAPANEVKEFDAIAVQRLDARKGLPDLIEAFSLLPGATLAIVGEGPMRPLLEQKLDELGLRARVRLMGERKDIENLLHRSRVFANASYEEGMPNAVLEAMASGLPVAATRVAGTSEAVLDQVTGTLVPPHSPPELAAAVARYLREPALAATHGAAGRARVLESFSYAAQAGRYLQLYEHLLGGG